MEYKKSWRILKESKIEDFLNWFVFTFQNPYKIVAGGNCPVQAEGVLPTGEFYYFRARHSRWAIEVAKNEQEWTEYNTLFRYEEKYEKHGQHGAGWMPRYEAIRFATVGIKKYYKK